MPIAGRCDAPASFRPLAESLPPLGPDSADRLPRACLKPHLPHVPANSSPPSSRRYTFICRKRNRFVKHLNARRKVSCAGPLMNNVGFLLEPGAAAKFAYQGKHLFGVSFENEASSGYQTEKIVDVLVSRSIPIYWGNPLVENEFNPEAFVNARRFPTEQALMEHVLELAEDPVRMAAIINAPRFRDPHVLEKAEQALHDFFARIFERGPGAIRRNCRQRTMAVLSRFYGHGFFRTMRRLSRHVRGKGGAQDLRSIIGLPPKKS